MDESVEHDLRQLKRYLRQLRACLVGEGKANAAELARDCRKDARKTESPLRKRLLRQIAELFELWPASMNSSDLPLHLDSRSFLHSVRMRTAMKVSAEDFRSQIALVSEKLSEWERRSTAASAQAQLAIAREAIRFLASELFGTIAIATLLAAQVEDLQADLNNATA